MIAGIAAPILGLGIGQTVFGSLGVAAIVTWPRLSTYRAAVAVQCAGAAAFAAYFALSGTSTAAASCIIALAQLLTSSLVRDRRVVICACAGSLVCLVLIASLTWNGIPTMLASAGCILGTLARVQKTTYRMKLWFLIAAPFWLAHNVVTASMFALVVDAVSITSNGSSVLASKINTRNNTVLNILRSVDETCRIANEFWQAARMCASPSYLPRFVAA
ncbi:YgjV family protein [Mesorhizobium sp.]|uniref:YgjV family protein n=1 Tax=Mesorhizobium sp. TaxID=1871066 RepID=UPI0025CBA1F6|nr:YgjV family protein [Mesorhizobium sp.]